MRSDNSNIKIALVAGEISGDSLGAGLISALLELIPNAYCEGVIGSGLAQTGCVQLADSKQLAVMGITEIIGRLPDLIRLRRSLIARWTADKIDLFIGIDAPDFNLDLAQRLRARGIPTVHYVSPSVWAWRPWRVRKIARAVDVMLTLFPFEVAFYNKHGIPAHFVGHPLADIIPMQSDRNAARRNLGLPENGAVVALLPGSRFSEINFLLNDFLKAAQWLTARRPTLQFILPVAAPYLRPAIDRAVAQHGQQLAITIVDGHARTALAAADVALLASGTATLEALLIGCPMVVAYRVAALTYYLAKPLMRIPYYSLPNLLAGQRLVPELIQDAVTPAALGEAVLNYLVHPENNSVLIKAFQKIHHQLRQNANQQAAAVIFNLINSKITSMTP